MPSGLDELKLPRKCAMIINSIKCYIEAVGATLDDRFPMRGLGDKWHL